MNHPGNVTEDLPACINIFLNFLGETLDMPYKKGSQRGRGLK